MSSKQKIPEAKADEKRVSELDISDFSVTTILLTYWSYIIGALVALIHFYFLRIFLKRPADAPEGYAPLLDPTSFLYYRCIAGRVIDCWNRPIASIAGPWIDVIERHGTYFFNNLDFTENTKRCLNLGSYNYLGFAEAEGKCTDSCVVTVRKYGSSCSSSALSSGTTQIHRDLEKLVARFVGKEDAVCFGMGYATNSTTLHAFIKKGGLIISDNLNHASIIIGLRSAQAKVKTFKHNDPADLERVIKEAVVEGQPITKRPWNKIMIVVEGIYSMEGEIVRLPEIVAIKKKYKAYLYVDEAHSIGALGPNGKGVCDYYGIKPSEIDVLMGTFTKSFGSAGGYIAGSKDLIKYLRASSFCGVYDTSMSTGVAQQIITSMSIILGETADKVDGKARLEAVRKNSNYFRRRMAEEGFTVIGDEDSPIVPVIITNPNKMTYFSRACLEHNIGTVVAGYPITSILMCRVRFCISASHKTEELEEAVVKMSKIGKLGMVNSW